MNQHSKEGKLISPLLTLKTDRKLYKEVCNFFTVTSILKKSITTPTRSQRRVP